MHTTVVGPVPFARRVVCAAGLLQCKLEVTSTRGGTDSYSCDRLQRAMQHWKLLEFTIAMCCLAGSSFSYLLLPLSPSFLQNSLPACMQAATVSRVQLLCHTSDRTRAPALTFGLARMLSEAESFATSCVLVQIAAKCSEHLAAQTFLLQRWQATITYWQAVQLSRPSHQESA